MTHPLLKRLEIWGIPSMKIKSLLILVSIIAGLCISTFTAFMTYLIIGEPIGMKMFSKITFMVVLTLPMIVLFSYTIGRYLSKKIENITIRLDNIEENNFEYLPSLEKIKDFEHIHQAISNLSQRLEKSIETLKQNNQNLTEMIQAFAHDIKTPITIIQGYIEEIQESEISQDEKEQAIEVITKELHFMNELSNHSISYVSSFKVGNTKELIPFRAFVQTEVFPLLHLKENTQLINEIQDNITVQINKLDMKQTLLNLLHNANKFTDEGYIKIYNNQNDIIIEDSGCGIHSDNVQTLFEPFVTDDKSKNRKSTGFGLGLSICKNLLKKNDYDIRFDSSYDKGARVIIYKRL